MMKIIDIHSQSMSVEIVLLKQIDYKYEWEQLIFNDLIISVKKTFHN